MERQNAILQARNTPNKKGYKGNHTVHQITIPKKIIEETGWKKGEKITISALGDKAIFEHGLKNNPDQKRINTLEKGLCNLSEHENLAPRLLKIEKETEEIHKMASINTIVIIIYGILFLIFGGMLL